MKAVALGLLACVVVACGAAPVARAHSAHGAAPSPYAWPSPFYSPSVVATLWPSPAPSAAAAVAQRPAPKPSPSHSPSPPPVACTVFPANSIFNKDISTLPVDSHSAAWMASASAGSTNLHPDFGAYPYGIPYNTVTPSHPSGSVTFQYASESDPNPYVVGADLKVEGTPNDGGDDHMLAYDPSACTLEEIYHAQLASSPYTGGSGAKWNLTSNALRPAGWTSADAAGLPIFPLLVRYSEVQAGFIGHALRFTVKCTDTAYEWPARHEAGTCGTNSGLPPMGARFRLKSSFNISGFSAQAQVILRAMQHYGMFVADNGSNWFFQGDENSGWPDALLTQLKSVPASEFEAVDESSLMVDPNSGQSR